MHEPITARAGIATLSGNGPDFCGHGACPSFPEEGYCSLPCSLYSLSLF